MSKLVRFSADILYTAILIFGLYVVAHGHLTPGGGFQGGAVIATGVALVIVAYSYEEIVGWIGKSGLMVREVVGLLGFIGAGLLAFFAAMPFFYNVLAGQGGLFGVPVPYGPNPGELNTGGVVPLMNFSVGIEVWGGFCLILLYLLSGLLKEDQQEEGS
ncbi:MAG: sodium:proton antiporter [Methanoregulaceae archaeon]|nr:sodium:proton antiporter [Methanoregulaceae archaeon]